MTMRGIGARVGQARAIMSGISVASREQAGWIDQVNFAVSLIGMMTHRNATAAGNVRCSADGLHDKPERLAQVVSVSGRDATGKVAVSTPNGMAQAGG